MDIDEMKMNNPRDMNNRCFFFVMNETYIVTK